MAEHTEISWTDHTWSPWEGCTKISPACDHCYAARMNGWLKAGENWGPGAPRLEYSDEHWKKPVRWAAKAQRDGTRPKVFPSVCDPFDNEVRPELRAKFFDLIYATQPLTWLLLTKRIGNVSSMLVGPGMPGRLPSNVWLGATVVTQAEADRDIPKLLATPAAVRFLSIEPMLGPIDLRMVAVPPDQDQLRRPWDFEGSKFNALQRHDEDRFHQPPAALDWVIAGGESGPHARPAHPDWFRSLRDQCAAAGVAFHFKQHGEWGEAGSRAASPSALPGNLCRVTTPGKPDHHVAVSIDGQRSLILYRWGKKAAGRLLDGVEHNGFPA